MLSARINFCLLLWWDISGFDKSEFHGQNTYFLVEGTKFGNL